MSIPNTFAVIGAGYGDEGKGLLTDALAAKLGPDTLVIRFNGGAQAGHTVTSPDGCRHVFHHVGSGSFVGAVTGLSRHFISNPQVLTDELNTLANLGVSPRIIADERGLLTTPWDMMINQFIEQERNAGRHGSCGLGIGETVERSLNVDYVTTLADLLGDAKALRARFDAIRRDWVPKRLTRLGMPQIWLRNRDLFLSKKVLDRAIVDAFGMLTQMDIVSRLVPPAATPVVFEGAQGLMLDQTIGAFPFVTRSNTGLLNIADVMEECERTPIEVFYGTRAYVTRHGAGPLAHEQPQPPSKHFADETNRPNPWQGVLRFGTLDIDVLDQAVRADLVSIASRPVKITPRLAVTCVDHLQQGNAAWIDTGKAKSGPVDTLLSSLKSRLPVEGEVVVSRGPSRETLDGLACTGKTVQNLGKLA